MYLLAMVFVTVHFSANQHLFVWIAFPLFEVYFFLSSFTFFCTSSIFWHVLSPRSFFNCDFLEEFSKNESRREKAVKHHHPRIRLYVYVHCLPDMWQHRGRFISQVSTQSINALLSSHMLPQTKCKCRHWNLSAVSISAANSHQKLQQHWIPWQRIH